MAGKDSLDSDKIKADLKTRHIGGRILVYDRTLSTNDVAVKYAKDEKNDGLVILTEQQSAGRGRAGAKWYSGRGDSILCSILLMDIKLSGELLSLTCAVAVAESLDKPGGKQARIKWPNDIILNGKKVGGILLESGINNSSKFYIIGIGLNCHQNRDSFGAELEPIATSIDIESGMFVDRIPLIKRMLISLDQWIEVAEKDIQKVTERWHSLSIHLGHRVTLLFNGRRFSGNCIGIDAEKGLIVQLDSGGVRMFDAAHTSIGKSGNWGIRT
jgi:BirA family biotin operon repressor/biotin-[acetyl-CoA-carboxylase] ligase